MQLRPPASPQARERSNWPAPWIFGVLILPQGIYLGFVTTTLPFLLGKAQAPVDQIAQITSLLSLPWIVCFLWAPLVDAKLRRRTWLVITASSAAVCLSLALPFANEARIGLVAGLSLCGAVGASLVLATSGGLMLTTLSVPAQAKASAWYEAGKLSSSALGAAFMLWLAAHCPSPITSLIVLLLVALPSFAALTISEPIPARSWCYKTRLVEVWSEIRALLRSRQMLSLVLLASPVGAGAAVALLPALAKSYGVGLIGVIWINGVGGGTVLALGALCGALLPGDWDRRATYAAAGLTNAFAAMILLSGRRPEVYLLGTILYVSTTGFCWARYAALLAEVVGPAGQAVSTRYSLLEAVGNIPLVYMVSLDGLGYRHFGTVGLLWTDASANILAFVTVAVVLLLLRNSKAQGVR